ncbi:MAG: GH32 C-terminal domain-containing protein [Spirochaetaceae bacterium]|nr:GH32 C-terminal domain-containing protein [Spirochaetaceae bacterium]
MEVTDGLTRRAMAAVAEAALRAAADPARPVYHFRPPGQWMNDVHGAFHHRGWYHVFFQFLPWSDDITAAKAAGIGWGHARSRDLVHWQFLPPALLPRAEDNARALASGSSWIRADGVPMLFFTHTPVGFPERKREPRGALPVDEELLTWRTVDLGLAPGNCGVPADIPAIWADIYLFGHGNRVFATFKQSNGLVCEAQNRELTEWRAVGHLGGTASIAADEGGVAGECPNVFTLQERCVLVRSTYPISYLLGDFDPEAVAFRADGPPRILDYGYGGAVQPALHSRGLYGTTAFVDPGGRTILAGWVSGFAKGRGWNGCMSLPRVLSIEGGRLIQTPLPELNLLRRRHTRIEHLHLHGGGARPIPEVRGKAVEIVAELAPRDAAACGLRVRCRADGSGGLAIRYTPGTLDVAGTRVPLRLAAGDTLRLHLLLDHSVTELFIQDGVAAVTRVDYPPEDDVAVALFADGGPATAISLDAWAINSIW